MAAAVSCRQVAWLYRDWVRLWCSASVETTWMVAGGTSPSEASVTWMRSFWRQGVRVVSYRLLYEFHGAGATNRMLPQAMSPRWMPGAGLTWYWVAWTPGAGMSSAGSGTPPGGVATRPSKLPRW